MTSRISFSKLVKQDLKRNTTMLLVSFLYVIITTFFSMTSLKDTYECYAGETESIKYIAESFSPLNSSADLIFTLILATVLAQNALAYLHKRNSADLTASLPITRKTLFSVDIASSFLIYIIPSLCGLIVKILFTALSGLLTGTVIYYMLATELLCILTYFAIWFTAALAFILTGNTLVGLLGCGVFYGYFPFLIRWLYPVFASIFYETYSSGDTLSGSTSSIWNFLSPVSASYQMFFGTSLFGLDTESNRWTFPDYMIPILGTIVLIIVIAIIDYMIYQKRPSESAGNAMTFTRFNSVLSVLLVVPLALYNGYFVNAMLCDTTDECSLPILIAGTAAGILIFHAVIQTIFEFDAKAIFSRKTSLLISSVLCFGFIAFLQCDLGGYDTWLPDVSDVEEIDFDCSELTDLTSFGDRVVQLKGDEEELANALEFLETVSEESAAFKDIYYSDSLENSDNEGEYCPSYVDVSYILKDGKKESRRYYFNADTSAPQMEELFDLSKESLFSVYTLTPSDLKQVTWTNGIDIQNLALDDTKAEELLNACREDLDNLTYEEILETPGRSELSFGTTSGSEISFYLYPACKNTEALLEQAGCDADGSIFEKYPVTKITVTGYKEDNDEEFESYVTDESFLKEISSSLMVSGETYDYNHENDSTDKYYQISLKVYLKTSDIDSSIYAVTDQDTLEKIVLHMQTK